MNQGQKSEVNNEQTRREQAKGFSEESTAETQIIKQEEVPSGNDVQSTKSSEQFAIAKFDYNAQKVQNSFLFI